MLVTIVIPPSFWQAAVQGLEEESHVCTFCLTVLDRLSFMNTSNHALICFKFLLSQHAVMMGSAINYSVEKVPPFPLVSTQAA